MSNANHQLHGKDFENLLKMCFPGSSDHQRGPTSSFDIEARFDKTKGLPTSIKSAKGRIVYLADARRFLAINEPYRLIVGRYLQQKDQKAFYEVIEYLIQPHEHRALCKGLDPEKVAAFDAKLRTFDEGEHVAARQYAKATVAAWKDLPIRVNPKIDSKRQRRVQCSVSLENLDAHVAQRTIHTQRYRQLALPIAVVSEERRFNKPKSKAGKSSP